MTFEGCRQDQLDMHHGQRFQCNDSDHHDKRIQSHYIVTAASSVNEVLQSAP